MNIWKLGDTWGSGEPSFYEFIVKHLIVLDGETRYRKKGDLVLIAQGYNIIAIAELTSDARPITDKPELRNEVLSYNIHYESWVLYNETILYELEKDDQFEYQYRPGNALIQKHYIKELGIKLWRKYKKKKSMEDIIKLLKTKKQLILQGPPGTGKTRRCIEIANQLIESENKEDQNGNVQIADSERIRLIQFHPSYSYEDFVRGIEADTTENGISYKTQDKSLLQIAKAAIQNKEHSYCLIIDEVNRANLPSVLGELIYALEYRENKVMCMYSASQDDDVWKENDIYLPENLYILGTMNTADHSVGNIDYAIRRRFGFISMAPDEHLLEDKGQQLFKTIQNIFYKHLSPEFNYDDVMIGHSYFMAKKKDSNEEDLDKLQIKLEYEIKPILYEYVKDGMLIDAPSLENNDDGKVKSVIDNLKVN